MDILTDYSTLAYYILSQPGAIVNEVPVPAQQEELPVNGGGGAAAGLDFRFAPPPQPSPVSRLAGGPDQPDPQNPQNSYGRI